MHLIDKQTVRKAVKDCNITDLGNATIGDMINMSLRLEELCPVKMVRMDQGSPSLPINHYGAEAEKEALDQGIGAVYPPPGGLQRLKDAATRFVKAFIDIDIPPVCCIPTTGSVESSFAAFIACTQRIPGKSKVLFIDPGFGIQKSQLLVLGIEWKSFDIYSHRGAEKLEAKLREELASGDIAAIVYSNPNNPAWICLEEEELKVIGSLADEFDFIVMEDLAYFCMDYRKELGHPFQAPFLPTVARYTGNYILMLSASKIFSYAGQRIGLCCISESLFDKQYPALARRYKDSGIFGLTLMASIMYMITSGCTSSTQIGYARMLELSCDGVLDFIEDTRVYERRTHRMKEIFCAHGFNVVYDKDVTAPVGDGFFFTLGYKDMSCAELVEALLCYGISSVSLTITGSEKNGIRACASTFRDDMFPLLEERLTEFEKDHSR